MVLAYGGVTPEKRITAAIHAIAATRHHHHDLRLLLVGTGPGTYDPRIVARAAGVADRLTVAGLREPARSLPSCLLAADAALALRWPTARETSAAWAQCIAAGLPTVLTDLVHLAHIPALEPRGWTVCHLESGGGPVVPRGHQHRHHRRGSAARACATPVDHGRAAARETGRRGARATSSAITRSRRCTTTTCG